MDCNSDRVVRIGADGSEDGLAGFYERYLACLNARDWDALSDFVTKGVVHNSRPLGLYGYRAMLEKNYRDIPDLRFQAEWLVAAPGRIAARLRFDCTPIGEFLGLQINGRRVLFHEHAFYDLQGGRIAEVFSVIDKVAIEAELGS